MCGNNEALVREIQAHPENKEALDTLVQRNLGLVYAWARRVHRFPRVAARFEIDDLVNAGVLGMIHAARRFDPTAGTLFSTYCVYWIHQRISKETRVGLPVRVPVNLALSMHVDSFSIHAPMAPPDGDTTGIEYTLEDALADDRQAPLDGAAWASELRVILNSRCESALTPREQRLLKMFYESGLSTREIGRSLSPPISGARVGDILRRSLRKLRATLRAEGYERSDFF